MTPEERQLIGGLFEKLREAAAGQERDAEVEAFINNAIKAQPYAPYIMAQTVIVMEETVKGSIQKIEELEAKVRDLEARSAAAPQQPASGGFLSGGLGRPVFGGAAAAGAAIGGASGMPGRSGVPSTSGISVPPPPEFIIARSKNVLSAVMDNPLTRHVGEQDTRDNPGI